MNAKTFIDEFDVLAAAPNGIKKLRELILQLAVQGKLISGDRNDYMQVSLRDVSTRIHYGYTASANHGITAVRLLRITDIQDNTVDWDSVPGCQIEGQNVPKYELHPGDILIARTGGTIGKTYLVTETPVCAVFASYLIRVIPSNRILSRFLKLFLESPDYWVQLREKSAGTGQPNVNGQALGSLKLDLPPLAEQKRIVAKVDELMRLCDELETRQKERNEKCVTLNGSCLNALLDIKDSCPANSHTERTCHAVVSRRSSTKTEAARRRIHDNFDILYDNPENVTELRKAILQLAVMGRLVPQDPSDEPASVLLEKIAEEKERLVKEGKIKKTKPLPPLDLDNNAPYELPQGWQWTSMQEVLLTVQTGPFGSSLHKQDYVSNGIPVVNPMHLVDGLIQPSNAMTVSSETFERLSSFRIDADDIIMARRGEMGRCAVVTADEDGWLCGTGSLLLKLSLGTYTEFVAIVLRSPMARAYLMGSAVGATMVNLNQGILMKMVVGLPPLAEQKRIVAKVAELMKLCDQLESKLTQSEREAESLMEAVVSSLCGRRGDAG